MNTSAAFPGEGALTARRTASASPCILVVDDDRELRQLIRLMMADLGYSTVEAGSVKEALGHIASWQVDLMLLDLFLGGADGRDLLKVLHRRKWKVPTVVVSAHISAQTAQELAELGVLGIVAKPFSKDRLTAEVQKALKR